MDQIAKERNCLGKYVDISDPSHLDYREDSFSLSIFHQNLLTGARRTARIYDTSSLYHMQIICHPSVPASPLFSMDEWNGNWEQLNKLAQSRTDLCSINVCWSECLTPLYMSLEMTWCAVDCLYKNHLSLFAVLDFMNFWPLALAKQWRKGKNKVWMYFLTAVTIKSVWTEANNKHVLFFFILAHGKLLLMSGG